jgi:hypothetical protein
MSDRRRRTAREPDLSHYLGYLLEKSDARQVSHLIETIDHLAGEDRNRAICAWARDNVPPEDVPQEIWFQLLEPAERDLSDDFIPHDSALSDVDSDYDERPDSITFASSSRIERAGAGLEVWPDRRLARADRPPMLSAAEPRRRDDFPNFVECVSREDFDARVRTFARLGPPEMRGALKGRVPDAIVVDPPYGGDKLTRILIAFHGLSESENPFIFLWASPCWLSAIRRAAAARLVVCDSICVELFAPNTHPVQITNEAGFRNSSRMIFLLRTVKDLPRYKWAQQRSSGVSFGIARPDAKSRGRWGMPPVPHAIAEKMLPVERGRQKRRFVEFWPTRNLPIPGWELYDEEC